VTRVAHYLGADLVGFTELDERWVYSHHYLPDTGGNPEVELPEGCDQVIVMGVELSFAEMRTAPTAVMTAETSLNYSRMALLVASLAEFIRGLGYTAVPSINDTALNVPLAVDAGLAQPSRAGYAITDRYGPRIRFCKVITDLPLKAARQAVDLGVMEFCEVCRKCAEACPPGALPLGERTSEGTSTSNNPGVLKWYADYERCRKYWAALGTNCGICLRVCPFNQKRGIHHTIVRRLVRLKLRWLNRVFVWLHGVLGYGRRRDPAQFWDGGSGASGGSRADGVVPG
jgi:reductive dehalogenase